VNPTLRWNLVGTVVVIISVASAACAGPTPTGGGQPSSGVSGDLVYIGGPAASAATSPHLEPGSVTALTPDGVNRAGSTFSEGEGFTLYLDPGTYRLVSKSGDAKCPEATVTVVADRFETIRIRCSVK
jgi:hypothetical protein